MRCRMSRDSKIRRNIGVKLIGRALVEVNFSPFGMNMVSDKFHLVGVWPASTQARKKR
jgi:hypothetical protein